MYVIVTRSFPPEVGGMQNLMWGLTCSIAKYNMVKVFADFHENYKEHDQKVSFSIDRVGGIKLLRKHRKSYLVNEFIKKNKNVSCVIADHWKSLELIKTSKKKICLIHSKEINHTVGSLLNKRLIKSTNKANYIIANSNFTKNLAIKVGIDESKIKVIFPGINKPKSINIKYKKEADIIFGDSFPKIITVARLDKRKGHDKILMVIKNLKIKFPKIKYVSIGFGDEEKNLKKLAKELKIENEVIFLKHHDENIKLALIEKSNLFLMPSRIEKKSVEGFGISFMEAASYSVGSIGGKDGGASDAITHNKSGLICDGNDLNSIYESVLYFFENEKYIEFGKTASKISENFHWDKIVKNYLKLIN